jgi:hypothetical protein
MERVQDAGGFKIPNRSTATHCLESRHALGNDADNGTMPQKDAQVTIRLKPSELGCAGPYRLTYFGQVFASLEARVLLAEFMRSFQTSVNRVVRYFLEVARRTGKDQLTAYLLIGPSNAPQHIVENEVWQAEMVEKSDFGTFKENAELRLIYAAAGYPVKTKVGRYFFELIKRCDLGISDLNVKKVEALFGLFPKLGPRDAVATAAFRVLKSFLSSSTNAQKIASEREAISAAAMARNPGFYIPFYNFCKNLSCWNHACRFYRLQRQALRTAGVPNSVINACQKVVMDRHRDVPAWAKINPVNDAERDIANQEPKVSEIFQQSLPSSDAIQEDIFRRYGKPGPPIFLAYDTHFIQTVLQLLNDTEKLFTTEADKEEFIHRIKKHGKISYHHGWVTICRDVAASRRKADPRFRRCVEFVTGELREFIRSCRVVRTPSLKPDLMAWPEIPQVMADWAGWEMLPAEQTRANEISVTIRLPAFRSVNRLEYKVTAVRATIRGHMPLAKAHLLDKQLDIKNQTRFRPDRFTLQASVFGKETKKTFTKAQALRLISRKGKIFAHIASENITEVERDPNSFGNFTDNIKPMERVAILHYLPGGCRLATMAIFERTAETSSPTGWRLIKFREQIGAKQQRHFVERTFLIIEDDEYNFAISNLVRHGQSAEPVDNADNSRAGEIKRHFGDTRYKQIASRIARICRDHKVSYLFVAGGGRLVSRGGVIHPVKRFFMMSRNRGRTTLAGFLVTAAVKNGIAVRCGTAKPVFISSKDTVLNGVVPSQPQVVCGFHQLKKAEFGYLAGVIASSKGRRDRAYDPITKSASSFVLNSSWSLLLYHFDKAFKASADRILDTLDEQVLEAFEDLEVNFKPVGCVQPVKQKMV